MPGVQKNSSSILLQHGFILTMTPVVAVSVPDRPGGLAQVLRLLPGEGIDVEYMYSVFGQVDGLAHMIFRVADDKAAETALASRGIQVLDQEQVERL